MNNSRDSRKKIFSPDVEMNKKKYHFKLAFAFAPHPQKVWKGGEDAIFVSKNIILVADGVGGWAKVGIDSGWYARHLVQSVKTLLKTQKQLFFIEHPEELALKAVQNNQQKGSATLSILTLHPDTGVLRSYHIGDSVFGIFSKEKCYFMAQEQQKSFNVPYQVFGGSKNTHKNNQYDDSDEQNVVSDVFKGIYHQFTPGQLKEKTIVLASDGLWDNLHQQMIIKQISQAKNYVEAAKMLVRKIKQISLLTEYESPFYLKGVGQNQKVQKTGKVDDTSIILAAVQSINV